MTTKLSSKGQVVLPVALRRKLGLRLGDDLSVHLEGEAIVLKPRRPKSPRFSVVRDARTGFPVIAATEAAPSLTSGQVEDLLTDFP